MKIFYDPLLMPTHQAQILLTVISADGSMPDYDNHEGAIVTRIRKLIIEAIADQEDVGDMIENYLNIPFYPGNPSQIAFQILESPQMLSQRNSLYASWSNYSITDTPVKKDGSQSRTTAKDEYQVSEEIEEMFTELTLREYLEQLSMTDEEI